MLSNTLVVSAFGETQTSRETWVYPNGLRKRNYGFSSNQMTGGSFSTYDGHDWLIKKKLGNGIQNISYGYNPRGWLNKINSVGSVSSFGGSGCEEPIDIPTPDLDCEKLFEIIQNFIIEYDCDKLNAGTPTNIDISIIGQEFEDGARANVDYQTVSIPVNGATESLGGVLPDSVTFDTNGSNSIGDLAGGIYNILLDCLDQNPGLLTILEAQILGALEETFEGGIIGTDPPNGGGESSAIHTNNPFFGMEIHYFEGNEKLEAPDRFNGNISWMK